MVIYILYKILYIIWFIFILLDIKLSSSTYFRVDGLQISICITLTNQLILSYSDFNRSVASQIKMDWIDSRFITHKF